MSQPINRREFLKLSALAPAAYLNLPQVISNVGRAAVASKQPNILFIVFDTLSASHIGLYGYERNTMPNLARFAERSTVYHAHYSTANFTTPATASIFTGVYPWTHRAFNLHGTVKEEFRQKNLFSLLPEGTWKSAYTHNLLATSLLVQFQDHIDELKNTRDLALVDEQYSDLLFPSDYNASFWSENLILRGSKTMPSSLFLSLVYKLLRLGYKGDVEKKYGELFPRGVPNLNDIYFVLEDAVDWLMERVRSSPRPFLGYYHFLPPHEPYSTRREFIDRFDDHYVPSPKPENIFSEGLTNKFLNNQRREYDEYIAYVDAEFGRFIDYLEQTGVFQDTYVIFGSDHGELFERGIRGHVTRALYEPLLRVPLLISSPGQQKRQDIFTPTSCIDLLPTLLHLTGQPVPEWCEGQVLPGLGGTETSGRSLYSLEAKTNPKMAPLTRGTITQITEQFKLIYYFGKRSPEQAYELYDLQKDPEEMENRYNPGSATAKDLRHLLDTKFQQVNQPFLTS